MPLGQRRLAGVALALVLEPGGPPDEEPAHLGPGDHLRDELLDQLVLADLLPEGVPLMGVSHAGIDAGLGEADGAGSDGEPPLIDGAHRDQEALAFLADAVLLGDPDVIEVDEPGVAGADAELAVERAGGKPVHAPFDDERGHALVPLLAVDRGEDQEVVGEVRQADPDLLPVEAICVAVATCGRPEVARVGPGRPARSNRTSPACRPSPGARASVGAAPPCPTGAARVNSTRRGRSGRHGTRYRHVPAPRTGSRS